MRKNTSSVQKYEEKGTARAVSGILFETLLSRNINCYTDIVRDAVRFL